MGVLKKIKNQYVELRDYFSMLKSIIIFIAFCIIMYYLYYYYNLFLDMKGQINNIENDVTSILAKVGGAVSSIKIP